MAQPTLKKPILKILANAGKSKIDKLTSARRRPLNRKFPLCIEAVSVTCGGDLWEQLRPFVQQIQFLHPEWPIHIAADLRAYESINTLVRPQDKVWIIHKEDHIKYAQSDQKDHGKRWSKAWIGIKLENFRRAIEHFNCGVLQCDSDFIFTRALEQVNWQADVVMSTHCGPLVRQDVPPLHGHYNAGLLLSDKFYIADRWIQLYKNGYGGFYEQKLLERFSELYVTGLFPDDWNWGPWRHAEDIKFNGRLPAILHAHIVGPHKQDLPLHRVAEDRMKMMERSYRTHNKLAFYHCSKAAGTEMMKQLEDIVDQVQYQILNSFAIRLSDWNAEELKSLCFGTHKYQEGNRWIVHNHGQGWDDNSVDLYLDNDWKFWAFYRPIRDRLLSFYYWSMDMISKTGRHPMSGPITKTPTIDDFLMMLTTDDQYIKEWALPHRAKEMLWYPANNSGISKCAKDLFNLRLSYESVNRSNASRNKGWDKTIERGLAKQETINHINNLPNVIAWDNFIDYATREI